MNRHTKLSSKQPYLSLNKFLYEETFEFEFYDFNSLKFWIQKIESECPDFKTDFQIKTEGNTCVIKFSRYQKEGDDISLEAIEKILESKGYLIVKPVLKSKIEPLTTSQLSTLLTPVKPLAALTTNYINNLFPTEFTYLHSNNTR
jgi:hypothetical protein